MLAITILFSLLLNLSISASWDHDTIDNWKNYWPECGYNSQSPIDITMTGETTTCDQSLILDWTSELQHYAIRNNGHSLVAIPFHIDSNGYGDISGLEVLHHTNDTKIRLRNSFYNTFKSPVNKEYCFDSLHFHWGSDNAHGSEHTVNGQEFPLELHLVHYSCDWYLLNDALYDYNSGEVAQRYDDDNVLAVIGVLFEIGAPNPVLQQILNDVIIDGVSQFHDPIEKFGDHLLEIFYDEFDIADLLPDNREVIAYEGSLTTPPCFETVRWHVMKHRMTVSEAQMDQFRVLLRGVNTTNSVAPNFRPVQELNDRQIFHCEEDVDALAVTKDAASNTDGDGSNPDGDDTDGYTGISGTEQTWFVIGVTFICLFGVSVIVMLYMAHIIHVLSSNKNDEAKRGRYSRAKSTESVKDDVEANEANGNGTTTALSNYH